MVECFHAITIDPKHFRCEQYCIILPLRNKLFPQNHLEFLHIRESLVSWSSRLDPRDSRRDTRDSISNVSSIEAWGSSLEVWVSSVNLLLSGTVPSKRSWSFWSALRIVTCGTVQDWKSVILGLPVKSDKSDWLRIWITRKTFALYAQEIKTSHRLRLLFLQID